MRKNDKLFQFVQLWITIIIVILPLYALILLKTRNDIFEFTFMFTMWFLTIVIFKYISNCNNRNRNG